MNKFVTMGLAVSLILGGSSAFAETTNTTQAASSGVTSEVTNKLSKHVYLIGMDDKDPNAVLRFEDASFPLRPELTVSIDGNVVDYGKYKPVNTLSGGAAIPLLQTLKAAGITYNKEGIFYVFSYNEVTYKIPFDGSRIMQIIKDNKVIHTFDTSANAAWVVDNEIYVNAAVFEIIFFKADPTQDDVMISYDSTVDGKPVHETMTQKEYNLRYDVLQYDATSLSNRVRVLSLYSTIDPHKEKDKANAALRKVMDTLPPDYYLEMRMPENEKAVMKSKAEEITKGITSEYDKVKAIHKWVATYLAYDLDAFNNNFQYVKQILTSGVSEAYNLLDLKRGMCSSYSELENQLIKAIGIPARSVTADATHQWVDAYVGDKWISTDPTWDTSDAIVNGERVKDYQYFRGKNSDNLEFFDFAPSVRYLLGNFSYSLDNQGTHEESSTTIYADWFWKTPYASNSKKAAPDTTVKEPAKNTAVPDSKTIPDPKPILLPSGSYDSSGKYVTRKPYTMDNVGVGINGKIVHVTPPARMLNGSTFIPLRGVFEAINAKVKWLGDVHSIEVVKDNITVKLTINEKTAYINGEPIALSTAPFISSEGATYVPLRFISETIGAKVGWDAANFVALIVTKPS